MHRLLLVSATLLFLLFVSACSLIEEQSPLTAEEQQWIKNHPGEVTVGVGLHYPPYETFDLDGHYRGLSADYIKLITEKTGLKFKPVRFRNREETLRALMDGRVDMMAALEMTPELRESLDFTQPYISVPAAIISRKECTEDLNMDKLAGMRIGVTVSEHFTKYLRERYPEGGYTVVPMVGGYIGGLRSLAVGDVDALICDMALASRYIANARISNLRIAGITNYSIELRIASRKDRPILGSILRKGLALILPHERQIIEEEWLSLQYRPFWASRTFWMGLFAVFCVVVGSIVLVLFWNRSLKRQVTQRTLALSSINTVLLGSLDCHTEQEVMLGCLAEARTMSDSEQASLAQVSPDGTMTRLLTVYEDNIKEDSASEDPYSMLLAPEQVSALKAGNVTRATSGTENMQLVAVPLQQEEGTLPKVIVVMRPRKLFSDSEVSALAEVLFAFEEALQRKRTEISLHEKERQLQRVQRMEALGTLAGGIAHDFNNLLGVIIANGEMIELFHLEKEQPLEAKTRAILAAAYRGRDLVSQILGFTNRGNEKVQLVHVSHIIKETVKFLQASLPASINIKHVINQPEPPVLADPTQVHQVLMNLCTNGAHAMEGDGGTLSLELGIDQTPACANTEGENAHTKFLCLAVRDTGSGIKPELMERIFDPFFTTKTPGKGTGLGLAMVQSIVKTWDGCVQVESELGKGTVFRVYLPAIKEQEFKPLARMDASKLPNGTGTILFVDDEQELADSYQEFLSSLGYNVHTMTDSNQALAFFSKAPETFDLVITDYSMPGLRGDKLAKAILAIRKDMPIILCTGYSHSFEEKDAKALGIRTFLNKPVELRSMALAVGRFMRPTDQGFKHDDIEDEGRTPWRKYLS